MYHVEIINKRECFILSQFFNGKKGVKGMVQEMTEKELITVTIDNYMNLQRIKKANGDTVNKELDYQLRGLVAKLSSLGVNVEDLTL